VRVATIHDSDFCQHNVANRTLTYALAEKTKEHTKV